MVTKQIIARKADGGISITHYDDRDDLNKIIEKHITAFGGTVLQIVDGDVEKPADRKDRDCWDFNGTKVIVDPIKRAAKQAKLAQRQAVLTKLGISEEELANLIKR